MHWNVSEIRKICLWNFLFCEFILLLAVTCDFVHVIVKKENLLIKRKVSLTIDKNIYN